MKYKISPNTEAYGVQLAAQFTVECNDRADIEGLIDKLQEFVGKSLSKDAVSYVNGRVYLINISSDTIENVRKF